MAFSQALSSSAISVRATAEKLPLELSGTAPLGSRRSQSRDAFEVRGTIHY